MKNFNYSGCSHYRTFQINIDNYQNDKAANHLIQVSGIIRNVQAGVMTDVIVKSKTKGKAVVSNNSGNFMIDVPANDILIISKPGYQTKYIPVSDSKIINVSISQSSF